MSDVEFEDDLPEVAGNTTDSKRIFINHVDSYNGKNIGRVIEFKFVNRLIWFTN